MSDKLMTIQQQMLGNVPMEATPIPKVINAELRPYQMEGVHWLERLRDMHLNGFWPTIWAWEKRSRRSSPSPRTKIKNKGIALDRLPDLACLQLERGVP